MPGEQHESATLQLWFPSDVFGEAVQFFQAEAAQRPTLSIEVERVPKHPTLQDQLTQPEHWILLKDALVVLVPVLLLWLGKGRKVAIKAGKNSIELTNYTAKDAAAILRAIRSIQAETPSVRGDKPDAPPRLPGR